MNLLKIFYYCYAGVHSSVIAGYIHLNILPRDRVPMIRQIVDLPEFDNGQGRDYGIPYFLGRDDRQNEVYLLGLGKNRALGLQTIIHLLGENSDRNQWVFLNALDQINWLTRVGGFISQRLKLGFGKRLAAWGIQLTYFKFVNLVTEEKERRG